jgi:hypothetical protein
MTDTKRHDRRRARDIGELLHAIVQPGRDHEACRLQARHVCVILADKFGLWADLRDRAGERDLARLTS